MKTRSSFTFTTETLPEKLPIFPLSGVLLLPRGELPLNIFEDRYLAMVEAALATPHRLIGMVQPKPEPDPAGDLYAIGCAGRITSFTETEDGRCLITLSGICRFQTTVELPQQSGFRLVRADFAPFLHDLQDGGLLDLDRTRLLVLLKEYFKVQGLSCSWDKIAQAPDDMLITALSMICPLDVEDKQALLEAPDSHARALLFLSLLERAVIGCGEDDHHDKTYCH